MKVTICLKEQKIEMNGASPEFAQLAGQLVYVLNTVAPKIEELSEIMEKRRPRAAPKDAPSEVDRLLDWMIDHGIVPPGSDK